MIKFLKSILARYLITVAVGLSFVYSYIAPRDLANQTLIEQYHILCDAFTLPGLFMMLIGLMLLMGNLGALDAISFAFHYLFRIFCGWSQQNKFFHNKPLINNILFLNRQRFFRNKFR